MLMIFASRFFIILIVFLFSKQLFAFKIEEGQISATAGIFPLKTKFDETHHFTSPWLGGAAMVINGGIDDKSALELSFFYMNKLFIREHQGNYISETTTLLQIGMGYCYWFTPKYSASLSFFSSYSLDDPRTIQSTIPDGIEVLTSARDTTEYGFDLAFQAEVWEKNDWSVITEARYSRSVTNKESEDADHYGIFMGLRYIIQEKQPKIKSSPQN